MTTTTSSPLSLSEDFRAEAAIFKAFCDPNRLAILALLREGEQCACVLQEQLPLTQSGLSYHVKILLNSGVVLAREEGKWTYYRLSPEGRDRAVALLTQLTTAKSVALGAASVANGCGCGGGCGASNASGRSGC